MMPKIVARKIANKCQASGLTPAGAGIYQMARPITIVINRGINWISFGGAGAFIGIAFII
jgi:hypothetical protein